MTLRGLIQGRMYDKMHSTIDVCTLVWIAEGLYRTTEPDYYMQLVHVGICFTLMPQSVLY